MLMEKERNLVVEYGKKLITENLTDRYAQVAVSVDFNKLNSVLVINQ